jgi:hypothetical protein
MLWRSVPRLRRKIERFLPAQGLDDHLGHHTVPERRRVVGEAGDSERVLGARGPSL